MKIDKNIVQLPINIHLCYYVLLLPFALYSTYNFESLVPLDTAFIISDIFLFLFCFKRLKYYTIISIVTIILLNLITESQLRLNFDYNHYYFAYCFTLVLSLTIMIALFSVKLHHKNANMDTTSS